MAATQVTVATLAVLVEAMAVTQVAVVVPIQAVAQIPLKVPAEAQVALVMVMVQAKALDRD